MLQRPIDIYALLIGLKLWSNIRNSRNIAQEMDSIKTFFSKYDQIHKTLGIWSHLLKKTLTVIRLGLLKLVFTGGWGTVTLTLPFIF